MDWGIDMVSIGLGALGTLGATWSISAVMASLRPPRVRDGLPGVRPPCAGVLPVLVASPAIDRDADDGSGVDESENLDGGGVVEIAPVASPAEQAATARGLAQRARMTVNAPEQIRDFIGYMIAEGYARPLVPLRPDQGRYTDAVWWQTYLAWTADAGVVPLSENIFLGALGKHPHIVRSRDRVKDMATGRVVKNAHGTPLRSTHYTLHERPLVDASSVDPVTGRRRHLRVAAGEVAVKVEPQAAPQPKHQRRAA